MTVRIFASLWSETPSGNQTHIDNPVIEYADLNNIAGSILTLYPQTDTNGRPKQVMIVSIMTGGIDIELIQNAPDTDMLPAYHGNTLIVDIPTPVKNQINAKLNSYGFKVDPFTAAITWQEAIVNLASEVDPDNSAVLNYLTEIPPEELA